MCTLLKRSRKLRMDLSQYLAGHLQHRPYEMALGRHQDPDRLLGRFSWFSDTTNSVRKTDSVIHARLHAERVCRLTLWHLLRQIFYYEPIFKAACESVGKNFELHAGIPLVMGFLRIWIGDDVRLSGLTTFVGSKMIHDPVLEIGSRTTIGHETSIVVGKGVHIGPGVTIGNGVSIFADDSHPLDPIARAQNAPPRLEDIQEVWIEQGAVVGDRSVILKGVRVGHRAVVLPCSVVTRDVGAHSVVVGSPARPLQPDSLQADCISWGGPFVGDAGSLSSPSTPDFGESFPGSTPM